MGHQPDWSSPAGGLVASVLGADEHDHLSSSVVITHQGQRPAAALTHSFCPLTVHWYMHITVSVMPSVSDHTSCYVGLMSKPHLEMWFCFWNGFTTVSLNSITTLVFSSVFLFIEYVTAAWITLSLHCLRPEIHRLLWERSFFLF